MAQKVQVFLVDDLDGGEAEETVEFGLDGSVYEIDLSGPNATQLREALTPFVQAGHKASTKQDKSSKRGSRATTWRERSSEIRAWAKAHGKPINARGRIPQSIVDEYETARKS